MLLKTALESFPAKPASVRQVSKKSPSVWAPADSSVSVPEVSVV
ncbi:MAG TPA: hypothetical protein PLF81_12505 [Candidatus Anammoximicrobium sp.]|nr:hypothetical protein [Candidatus Anammoximicrobium sp.]